MVRVLGGGSGTASSCFIRQITASSSCLAQVYSEKTPPPLNKDSGQDKCNDCSARAISDLKSESNRGDQAMAKGRGDFTDILLKKSVLSSDQLTEARALAQQTGAKIQDALVKLGYC